jgi:hypothetical protein
LQYHLPQHYDEDLLFVSTSLSTRAPTRAN